MSRTDGDELLYAIGEAFGYALAPLIKGLQDGAADRAVNEAALSVESEDEAAAEDDKKADDMVKEQYAICHDCACAYCADIESCKKVDCPMLYGGVLDDLCAGVEECCDRIATEHCNIG